MVSRSRSIWTTLLLLLLTATVRAHLHFVRMAVLALAGLAGMYMLHLLAQDYNKITNRPSAPKALLAAGKALGLFKRSVPSDFDYVIDTSENEIQVYDRILEKDPMGCARKLVCTLATRPRSKLLKEEAAILNMIRPHDENAFGGYGKEELEEAANIGATEKNESACEEHYKKCHYTAEQLLKIMRAF